ncbi:MAG: thiamine-phosphate kinase [Verrucomicrobia bacterium]|nr:thiamine-phosphate kinase [Verrucomicrobiota bacterium]
MSVLTLANLGEDALVHRLMQKVPLAADVLTGAGDDCAVVKSLGKGWLQLLKTDCVVEGVHFTRGTKSQRVGWKALARAVSDIAAMGGTPDHALVTLLAPPDRKVSDMVQLYAGLRKCARKFGISIIGGETSGSPVFAVVISLTGRVKAAHCVRRDGAKAGDEIFVTGRLGGSRRGHHLDFIPRISEGQWLAENFKPRAMMDLSDGLAKDLPRMALASRVEFVVQEAALPCNKNCRAEQAWSDGEDHELLLAVSPRISRELECAWQKKFRKTPLTRIGFFVPKGKGSAPSFSGKGWEHFKRQPRESAKSD